MTDEIDMSMSTLVELGKCQSAFNELHDNHKKLIEKYKLLLEIVKDLCK